MTRLVLSLQKIKLLGHKWLPLLSAINLPNLSFHLKLFGTFEVLFKLFYLKSTPGVPNSLKWNKMFFFIIGYIVRLPFFA